MFVDFHDFDDFCWGPVQDFSQNDTILERSYNIVPLQFLRVFNFPIPCGSVLIVSLQKSLQISCDFQVFLRFSMKSTNLNTFLSRSHYSIDVFDCKISAFSFW